MFYADQIDLYKQLFTEIVIGDMQNEYIEHDINTVHKYIRRSLINIKSKINNELFDSDIETKIDKIFNISNIPIISKTDVMNLLGTTMIMPIVDSLKNFEFLYQALACEVNIRATEGKPSEFKYPIFRVDERIREDYLSKRKALINKENTIYNSNNEINNINIKISKAHEELLNIEKIITKSFGSIKSNADTITKEYNNINKIVEQNKSKVEKFIQQQEISLVENANDVKLTIIKHLEETEERIKNFEVSANESLSTMQMGKLWDSRANSAFWSLIFIGLILAGMFGTAIAGIPYYKDEISALIKIDENINVAQSTLFALQVSRTFLIAVPIFMYFWAIKLLIRVFIRSLLLFDDARQRRTIMDTYLFMLKNGQVDEKFMPLILWALCRQVPGHGSDGIEPPDFTEVVNAGLNFKNTPG